MTESFLFSCYKLGLTKSDLEEMTISMCLDYITMATSEDTKKQSVRKASQEDFDRF